MDDLAANLASVLAAHAEATPEAPFLFFRGPRGHFVWWSWRDANEVLTPAEDRLEVDAGATAAAEFLRALVAIEGTERSAAKRLLAAVPVRPRQIWLTTGALDRFADRVVAVAALAGGWAVVHEPGEEIHPATFAWARPTIVGGGEDELLALLTGLEALAPRWRPRAWTARRLTRLAALVVERGGDRTAIESRLRSLGGAAAVLSIP